MRPELYFDIASPYAYLALERAPDVLGVAPELRPILVGAIFALRGRGSWALTDARADGMAEIERRAAAYGLPLRWPEGWPINSLATMRAAVWAQQHGGVAAFTRAAMRRHFGAGEDIAGPEALADVAREAGLPGDELPVALQDPALKERLKQLTAEAWERGVRGVPTVVVGDDVFFGDDRLEEAARRAGCDRPPPRPGTGG